MNRTDLLCSRALCRNIFDQLSVGFYRGEPIGQGSPLTRGVKKSFLHKPSMLEIDNGVAHFAEPVVVVADDDQACAPFLLCKD